jgi:hypothetical protein
MSHTKLTKINSAVVSACIHLEASRSVLLWGPFNKLREYPVHVIHQ